MSSDGRVIDDQADGHTTSEGQSYALFFALVAGDRARFELLLRWTRDNLVRGELGARLPAWRWGVLSGGGYGVIDANAASDADLWLGYALLEAGRLWGEPRYAAAAQAHLARVVAEEVRTLPGLGPMVLPGPQGFALDADTWRLNPSYTPLPLLRRFASARVPGPWAAVAVNAVRVLGAAAPHGLVPDWVAWRAGQGVVVDPVAGAAAVGGYDAVRVALWSGLTPAEDPLARAVARASGGLLAAYRARGFVPERVDTTVAGGGAALVPGPAGFLGAVLPGAAGSPAAGRIRAQLARLAVGDLYGNPPYYYDQVLLLFGLGFAEGRYRFLADGALAPRWRSVCRAR